MAAYYNDERKLFGIRTDEDFYFWHTVKYTLWKIHQQKFKSKTWFGETRDMDEKDATLIFLYLRNPKTFYEH